MVALYYHWPFGWMLSECSSTMSILNFLANVFLLTLISMDHCVSPTVEGDHHSMVPNTDLQPFCLWLHSPSGHSHLLLHPCSLEVKIKPTGQIQLTLPGPCGRSDFLLPLLVALASVPNREDLYQVALLIRLLDSSVAFINTCLNPVLYVFTRHDFWEHLFHSLPAALECMLSEETDRGLNPSSWTNESFTIRTQFPDLSDHNLLHLPRQVYRNPKSNSIL
ncbi:hypothetical protein HPG69_016934 [Diceros bicornis minor]|uniref:G-protein coupled receptors family 1 profile domain-containing protein n=1 Tax=Diceros bicornis minor TaxID=77932 RepID=A0A7J7EC56_DICBM|nr:hypothetical protein HPG69_016934 [Diceros bicornis minor]